METRARGCGVGRRATAILAGLGLMATACATESAGTKTAVGAATGAAAGGLIGAAAGGGTTGIIGGVLLGGLLGGAVGNALDQRDRQYHDRTAQQTFESTPTGSVGSWQNPDSGHSGTITPTRTYETSSGQPCREFTQTIQVGGQTEEAYGTACRQADGSWKIIQ